MKPGCGGLSGLDYWRSEILASFCTIGMLHFLAGFLSSVEFLSKSTCWVTLCLNLEGAAGLGLIVCYHGLCWNYSLNFCFFDLLKFRNCQYHNKVTEERVLESVCIAEIHNPHGTHFLAV